jgi:hypothetical protein
MERTLEFVEDTHNPERYALLPMAAVYDRQAAMQ